MPSAATDPVQKSKTGKKLLRAHCLRLRRHRSTDINRRDSVRILHTLKNLPAALQAKRIHSFLGQQDEPDTLAFLRWVLQCGKEVAVPCIEPGDPELRHSLLILLEDLEPGPYGILEIPFEKRIDVKPGSLDLALIPGVAFDLCGGRLGYGKGYYDRFLKRTRAFRIGVCFSSQIVESVPMEDHDIPMQGLVSEKGWQWIEEADSSL